MVNPDIEELRKKAYILYDGMYGPKRVNDVIKRHGKKEDKLEKQEVEELKKQILKEVFVDQYGMERTKEVMRREIAHLSSYKSTAEQELEITRIKDKFNLTKWMFIGFLLLLIGLGAIGGYYLIAYDPLDVCDSMSGQVARDSCFLNLALASGNSTYCGNISVRNHAFNCIRSVAVKYNNTEICEQIPQENVELMAMHDNCIICISYKLRRVSICSLLRDPVKEAECMNQIDTGRALNC
jgi:hypothetical protein